MTTPAACEWVREQVNNLLRGSVHRKIQVEITIQLLKDIAKLLAAAPSPAPVPPNEVLTEDAWNAGQEQKLTQIEHMWSALSAIAAGRTDCGRPLASETARQTARDCLVKCELSWSNAPPVPPSPLAEENARLLQALKRAPTVAELEKMFAETAYMVPAVKGWAIEHAIGICKAIMTFQFERAEKETK